VDVVGGAPNDQRWSFRALANPSQVRMQPIARDGIGQERLAILRRKDNVNIDLHKQLWHGSVLENLFEVRAWGNMLIPGCARWRSRPWALFGNSFGVRMPKPIRMAIPILPSRLE
jgi:hypothetical protein